MDAKVSIKTITVQSLFRYISFSSLLPLIALGLKNFFLEQFVLQMFTVSLYSIEFVMLPKENKYQKNIFMMYVFNPLRFFKKG